VVRWDRGGSLAAVGLLDGPVLRLALAPPTRESPQAAAEIIESLGSVLPEGEAWIDVAYATAVRTALTDSGWTDDDDPWPRFVRSLAVAPAFPPNAELVTPATAEERVAVQRGSFVNSTFSVARWEAMMAPPGGAAAIDVLVRDADGRAVAAATAWFAGTDRCGSLEPVGTLTTDQGRGHGRTAVLAACAALAERGASAATVTTPERNVAGVALYRSAGFTTVGLQRDLHRKPTGTQAGQ
jgi:GNAT superfamily N-acetyltransferase